MRAGELEKTEGGHEDDEELTRRRRPFRCIVRLACYGEERQREGGIRVSRAERERLAGGRSAERGCSLEETWHDLVPPPAPAILPISLSDFLTETSCIPTASRVAALRGLSSLLLPRQPCPSESLRHAVYCTSSPFDPSRPAHYLPWLQKTKWTLNPLRALRLSLPPLPLPLLRPPFGLHPNHILALSSVRWMPQQASCPEGKLSFPKASRLCPNTATEVSSVD